VKRRLPIPLNKLHQPSEVSQIWAMCLHFILIFFQNIQHQQEGHNCKYVPGATGVVHDCNQQAPKLKQSHGIVVGRAISDIVLVTNLKKLQLSTIKRFKIGLDMSCDVMNAKPQVKRREYIATPWTLVSSTDNRIFSVEVRWHGDRQGCPTPTLLTANQIYKTRIHCTVWNTFGLATTCKYQLTC